jgi:hypothetical protein
MTVIELPDDQAAALTAKAKAQGLTLEDWLKSLAAADVRSEDRNLDSRPISQVIAEIMQDVPKEAYAQLPRDGASQVDHYVYGLPKRY